MQTNITKQKEMTRRKLLKKFLVGGAATSATTLGVGGLVCHISHANKLKKIRRECDAAMVNSLQERQASDASLLTTDVWLQQTEETLNERVLKRSWKAEGIRSEGSLKYFLGDFDFDHVKEWDEEKDKYTQKWLGRCGCVAHYVVLQAARSGFSDVRIYFALHPQAYSSICPLKMHYYPVVGRHDTGPENEQYWILNQDSDTYKFEEVPKNELVLFMEKDYKSENVSLCMQSEQPLFNHPSPHPDTIAMVAR